MVFGLSGIFGMFFVSVASTLLNFFFPLSPVIIFSILVGGIISAYVSRNQMIMDLSRSEKIAIVICSLLVFILIPVIWRNYYDTGLYHLPAMRWILESPLTVGLANLHGRLGFNSLWIPLVSVIDGFTIILNDPFFLLNGIMTIFYCSVAVIRSIRVYREQCSLQFSDIFLLFSFIPLFLNGPNFINSASPDFAILILSLLIVYLYLYAYEHEKFLKTIFIIAFLLSLFALTIKMSAIILCLCTAGSLVYYAYREQHFSHKAGTLKKLTDARRIINMYYAPLFLTLFIVTIWIIRGILLSGYVLYPLPWTGIQELPWTVSLSSAQNEQDAVIGWARNPGPDYRSSLHTWMWIPGWVAVYAKQLFVPSVILLGAVILLIVYKLYLKSPWIKKEPFFHILSISAIGIIFWFLSAPDPRFGLGAIYGFCLGILAWVVYQYISMDIPFRYNTRYFSILIYCALLIIGGGIVCLFVFSQYNGSITPEFPHPDLDTKLTHEGYTVYTSKNGDQLWNSPLPNTPYFQKNISFIYRTGSSLPVLILPE